MTPPPPGKFPTGPSRAELLELARRLDGIDFRPRSSLEPEILGLVQRQAGAAPAARLAPLGMAAVLLLLAGLVFGFWRVMLRLE